MLNTESDRREGILDFVRDLTRHLAPGQHTLRARDLDPAELQVSSQTLGRDSTEPECGQRASRCGEKDEDAEIPTSPIEHEVVAASRCREDVTLLRRTKSGAVTKQHFRIANR